MYITIAKAFLLYYFIVTIDLRPQKKKKRSAEVLLLFHKMFILLHIIHRPMCFSPKYSYMVRTYEKYTHLFSTIITQFLMHANGNVGHPLKFYNIHFDDV